MFEKELQSIGLTEGESKVYEALFVLESSTVGPIVKKSRVAYSKVYEILDKLIAKGLVSYLIKDDIRYFQATSLDRLNDYIKTQEDEVKRNKEVVAKIMPPMRNMQKMASRKEEAEVFIGFKGIKSAYDILIDDTAKNKELCFFYVYEPEYEERSLDFYTKTFDYFKRIGIRMRGISNLEYKEALIKYPKAFYKQKYVDFPLPGNIDICGNNILITTWGVQTVGILIRSGEVAKRFQNYFDMVWKVARH